MFNKVRYLWGTDFNFKKYGKFEITVFYNNKFNTIKEDRIVIVTKHSFSINDFLK